MVPATVHTREKRNSPCSQRKICWLDRPSYNSLSSSSFILISSKSEREGGLGRAECSGCKRWTGWGCLWRAWEGDWCWLSIHPTPNPLLYACIHTHSDDMLIWLCMSVYRIMCVYKSEGTGGGQRLMLGVCLDCFSLHFVRRGLSLNLELANLARLAGQWAPGMLLSPPLECWNNRHYLPSLAFYLGTGDLNSVLIPAWQTLYRLNYFPGPYIFFYCG